MVLADELSAHWECQGESIRVRISSTDLEGSVMNKFCRTLIPIALWLGIATFALALFLVAFGIRFLATLTPGGIVRCAQTFLLLAMAAYCAHKVAAHL
jgi:hypothetical protein